MSHVQVRLTEQFLRISLVAGPIIVATIALAALRLTAEPQSSAQTPGAKPAHAPMAGTDAVGRNPDFDGKDWPCYGGGAANQHYSALAQINRENVKRLAVAWSFDSQEEGGLQCTAHVRGVSEAAPAHPIGGCSETPSSSPATSHASPQRVPLRRC